MSLRVQDNHGFSLIELAMVVLVLGILFAFGLPAMGNLSQSNQLRGASENLVGTIQLQRTRAMSTGQSVVLNFNTAPAGWTVMSNGSSVKKVLPNGITYESAAPTTITITRDGRVNTSALVVFRNRQSKLDTVSVMVSGLALIR